MEVWSILKEHIDMTDELKLEQLYKMITTRGYRYREEPHTEFKELLASLPVESVILSNVSGSMRNFYCSPNKLKSTHPSFIKKLGEGAK